MVRGRLHLQPTQLQTTLNIVGDRREVGRETQYSSCPSYVTLFLPSVNSAIYICKLNLQPALWKLSRIDCGKLQGSTLDYGIFYLWSTQLLSQIGRAYNRIEFQNLGCSMVPNCGLINFCTRFFHVLFVYVLLCIFVYFPVHLCILFSNI